jgi:hypothetical protein
MATGLGDLITGAGNQGMSVTGQAGNPDSVSSIFLEA